MKIVHFLVFIGYFEIINCSKILGVYPMPGPSHFAMFGQLMKGLAEKGHEVDVVSYFPQKTPIPRYNDISLEGVQEVLANNLAIDLVKPAIDNPFLMLVILMQMAGHETCGLLLNENTTVTSSLKNTTKKYDVLITEIFASDCFLGLAHKHEIPVVSVSSTVMFPWGNDRIGNVDNPSYISNTFLPYSSRMTFKERFINTVYTAYSKCIYGFYTRFVYNKYSKQFFGSDLPDLQELIKNTSLVLVNSHFSIHQARPTVPNFIEVAGLHIGQPKPLPKDLEQLFNTTKNGIIYLSMGSMLRTESYDKEKLQGMFDAFAELPYEVVWKAKKENFPEGLQFPSNIHFRSWLPQLDVLCHPKVKLFVTHGGLMGTQEAIYCGVPLLGIPIFGDQKLNINNYEKQGFAIKVAYDDISKDTILDASTNLLQDQKYKERCEFTSRIFKDRPSSAMDTAIYWIEYVIRYKGAPHLRSVGADLPWYQYHLVDVFAAFFAIVIMAVYFFLTTIKFVRSIFKKRDKDKKKLD